MQKTMDSFQSWRHFKCILLYSFMKLHGSDCRNEIIEFNSHHFAKFNNRQRLEIKKKKNAVYLSDVCAFLVL